MAFDVVWMHFGPGGFFKWCNWLPTFTVLWFALWSSHRVWDELSWKMSVSSGVFQWAFSILSTQLREVDKRQHKVKQNQHPSKHWDVYSLNLKFSPQLFHSLDPLISVCTPSIDIRKLFSFSVTFEEAQQWVYSWSWTVYLFLESFICFAYRHFADFLLSPQLNVLSCSQERRNLFFFSRVQPHLKSRYLLWCIL